MAWPPKCLIFWLSSVIGDLVVLKCQLEWAGLNQFELSTLTRGKLLWGRNPLACLHDCAHPKKKIHLQSCCLTGVFGSLLETSNHTKSQEDTKKTQWSMDHMDHMGQSGPRTVEMSLHYWLGRLCDRPLNLLSILVQHLGASIKIDPAAVIEVLLWKSCHLFTLLLQLMQSLLLKAKLHHLQQIYSR